MHARDLKAVLLEDVAQLGITDRIDVRGDLFAVIVFRAQALDLRARHWLEVRSVTVEQPLQTFFDIQNVGNADYHFPARPQHPRKLANCLLRILDVLQPFETGDIVECPISERQLAIQVTLANADTLQAKDLRIKITATYFKSGHD